MSAIAGKGGQINYDVSGTPTIIAEVTSWTIDITADALDVTAMTAAGTTWRSFIFGLRTWTCTIEANWDMTDSTQAALQTDLLSGTAAATVQGYTNATNYYEGEMYVTGISISTPVEGVVTASISGQGTGAVTYN